MSCYQYHLFFCINLKSDGKKCCALGNSAQLRDYAKQKLKKLGIHTKGLCRAMTCSCLGWCDMGPVLVIYPEDIWYSYKTHNDIDEIIERHILLGKPVERLIIFR